MGRFGGRRLDPTALYAAVMTIACLCVSMYPVPARLETSVAESGTGACSASVIPALTVLDSASIQLRAAVLGPAPATEIAGR